MNHLGESKPLYSKKGKSLSFLHFKITICSGAIQRTKGLNVPDKSPNLRVKRRRMSSA